MAQANLNNEVYKVDTSLDNVVIISVIERSQAIALDVSGHKLPYVRAGHVIIRDTQGSKEYKPMPVHTDGLKYGDIPGNHEVVGVALSSIISGQELATILVRGSVNEVASPYPPSEEIKKALPFIRFTQDN